MRLLVSSTTLFVLGLLSSEVALCMSGFVLSYELVFVQAPWSHRLRAAAPVLGLSILYLVFYETMGFGTAGSDLYNDPFSEPATFFAQLGPKLLALVGAMLFGVPASMRVLSGLEMVSLGAGALGVGLLLGGIFFSWSRLSGSEKRTIKWLLAMAGFTLFPAVAGIAQGREFMLFAIALSGLVALTLRSIFSKRDPGAGRILPRALGVLLFAGTLVFSPLARLGMSYLVYLHSSISRQIGESQTGCAEGSDVLVLTGNFDVPIIYAPHLVAHHQGRFFRSWHQLAVSEDPVTLSRPAVDRIVLSSSRRLVDPLLLREKDNPLVRGDVVERRRMRLRMVEVSNEGPTKIDITFNSSEDVSTVCLLKTENGVLKPLALPPVGDSITVPYVPFSNH